MRPTLIILNVLLGICLVGCATESPPEGPPDPPLAEESPPGEPACRPSGVCPGGRPPNPPLTSPPEDGPGRGDPNLPGLNYGVVRVFYATDRNLNTDKKLGEIFGGDRGVMTYGTCDVSIPRDHRMGYLEEPSIWRLEWREDPNKHVVLLAVDVLSDKNFFPLLADQIKATPEKKALVFIHGYNVSFEDAARRTAQISYDLVFDGAPIFFSWPSQGTLAGYVVDETNIEWAEPHLTEFLIDVATRTKADSIYLIAHSMGNRALTKAIISLAQKSPSLASVFREIILSAPDIDAEVFKKNIVPHMVGVANNITLYASSNDIALAASKKFHRYIRAGDSLKVPIITKGIDTIDASRISTDFLGHAYFAEHKSVVSDIYYLIRGIKAKERHGLRGKTTPEGVYWEFQP